MFTDKRYQYEILVLRVPNPDQGPKSDRSTIFYMYLIFFFLIFDQNALFYFLNTTGRKNENDSAVWRSVGGKNKKKNTHTLLTDPPRRTTELKRTGRTA